MRPKPATDDAITVDDETTVDVAATKTREAVVGSALLLAAGVIATGLTDDRPISPIVVFVLAAVVGGEQLWHRRRHIPSHVPVTLVMAIRVVRWQKRHDHVLAWVGSGDELESRILL